MSFISRTRSSLHRFRVFDGSEETSIIVRSWPPPPRGVSVSRPWQRRKPTLEPTIDEWQGVDNLDLCLSSSQRWVRRNGSWRRGGGCCVRRSLTFHSSCRRWRVSTFKLDCSTEYQGGHVPARRLVRSTSKRCRQDLSGDTFWRIFFWRKFLKRCWVGFGRLALLWANTLRVAFPNASCVPLFVLAITAPPRAL